MIVTVSPVIAVAISVPPAIVKESVSESALVVPVSATIDSHKFCDPAPAISSAGNHLLLEVFHFNTCPLLGAFDTTSTSPTKPREEYSVNTFALASPTPPAVILMFTYGLSSPSTVKK